MKSILMLTAAAGALALATGAQATTNSYSTFEDSTLTKGHYTDVSSIDGWTGGAHGIELQNNIAGAPASDGGNIFVELDTSANSTMSRQIEAGSYAVTYEYSARPNQPASTTGIEVLVNGAAVGGVVSATGGSTTSWKTITDYFTVSSTSTLTFAAEGTSDSFGGYVDNIRVSAAPEPATWALMFTGVFGIGMALRLANRKATAAVAG